MNKPRTVLLSVEPLIGHYDPDPVKYISNHIRIADISGIFFIVIPLTLPSYFLLRLCRGNHKLRAVDMYLKCQMTPRLNGQFCWIQHPMLFVNPPNLSGRDGHVNLNTATDIWQLVRRNITLGDTQ